MFQAKITDLTIALEPEAASVFCRHLPAADEKMNLSTFPPGTQYLILDAGGTSPQTVQYQL